MRHREGDPFYRFASMCGTLSVIRRVTRRVCSSRMFVNDKSIHCFIGTDRRQIITAKTGQMSGISSIAGLMTFLID